MFHCKDCGRTAPADPDSGYDADELCPDCRQAEEERTGQDLDTLAEDADYRYERWAESLGRKGQGRD